MKKAQIPLVAGICFGVLAGTYMLFISSFAIGTDFQAYYSAIKAFLSGESIYAAAPPAHPNHHFIYLPATLLWFLPLGLFTEWQQAFFLMAAVNLLAAGWFSREIIRFIAWRKISLNRIDKGLIVGFILSSTFSIPNILQGQVNLLLGIVIGTSFLMQLRGQSVKAGVLIGAAATLKLFPAVIGIWFVKERDWRALIIAITTGIIHIILSIIGFGIDTTMEFFTEILPRRFESSGGTGFDPGLSQVTIRRPLAETFGLSGTALSLAALAIGALIIISFFRASENDRLIELLVLVTTTLVAFPSYFIYLPIVIFPLIPLLYLHPNSKLLMTGTVFLTATFTVEHVTAVADAIPLPVIEGIVSIFKVPMSIVTPPLAGYSLLLIWAIWEVRFGTLAEEGDVTPRPDG